MTIKQEAETKLLEEGADSYVPAVSAILAFRELVHSRCEQVVQNRLKEYSAALGVALDGGCLRKYKSSESDWDGESANIGVLINNFGDIKAEMYHLLCWELGDDRKWSTTVGITIWLPRRKQVDRLWEAFLPSSPGLSRGDSNEIWLYDQVSHADIAGFDQRLDDVLERWIKLWKRAGGFKAFAEE